MSTTYLAGLALGNSLLQGPGAVHNFPNDVADLGQDAQNAPADKFDQLNR